MGRIPRFLAAIATLSLPLWGASPARATLTNINAGLSGVTDAALAWGDYDLDGRLDLIVTGQTLGVRIGKLYHNTVSGFVDSGLLPASAVVSLGSVTWGDVDGDSVLDFAIAGSSATGLITRVYLSSVGSFVDIADLIGLQDCALAWGDFDGDGDLDLAAAGWTGTANDARIYRNDDGDFSNTLASFPGVRYAAMAVADYDNDGDLDLALAGNTASGTTTSLYRNEAPGAFTSVAWGLPPISGGGMAWGDYDQDGDADIAIAGSGSSHIYRNDGVAFADVGASLQPAFFGGAVSWADYDNDGDLDCLISGQSLSVPFTTLYQNNNGTFTGISSGLPASAEPAVGWADFDNDTRLDVAFACHSGTSDIAAIYLNSGTPLNTRPTVPTGLTASRLSGNRVRFSWIGSSDSQTQPAGITYNVRVGTTSGGGDIEPGMANPPTGFRRVARPGNVAHRTDQTLTLPSLGQSYFWSVQAIDQSLGASAFAADQSNIVGVGDVPETADFALAGDNPFQDLARFRFSIPADSEIDLALYDLAGRRVRSLAHGRHAAGPAIVTWRGDDETGRTAPAGLYFARFRTAGTSRTLRILKLQSR